MDLERDEFVISYDSSHATVADLIAASKETGFPAHVVSQSEADDEATFFRDALARARRERKPIVLDFTADWCEPCQRMLRQTFPDPRVAPLLDQCVLVKVDTDEHPGLSQKFGVVGLPDIRLLDPDGKEVRRLLDFQGPEAFASVLEDLLRAESADALRVTDVTEADQNLRDAFNQAKGHVRLVLILSPT